MEPLWETRAVACCGTTSDGWRRTPTNPRATTEQARWLALPAGEDAVELLQPCRSDEEIRSRETSFTWSHCGRPELPLAVVQGAMTGGWRRAPANPRAATEQVRRLALPAGEAAVEVLQPCRSGEELRSRETSFTSSSLLPPTPAHATHQSPLSHQKLVKPWTFHKSVTNQTSMVSCKLSANRHGFLLFSTFCSTSNSSNRESVAHWEKDVISDPCTP